MHPLAHCIQHVFEEVALCSLHDHLWSAQVACRVDQFILAIGVMPQLYVFTACSIATSLLLCLVCSF